MKFAVCSFFILAFLMPTASATKWVTDITECGTAYMSIDCEADQYVCGFDGIMNCATPKEADQAKEKTETAFNLNSGLPSGLVLDCHSEAASCLPWQCQTDTTCDTANQNTECLKAGGFKCGECKAGYLNCDNEAGCETADGSESGPHARYQGCKGIVCDAGYLDCDGKSTNGCEIEIGGACSKDGQTGNYSKTCIGNQPPNCSVFAQQFATVQTSSGETIASQLQIDEQGNINIPVDAKFMVGGVALGTDETKTCAEKQLKLGTQCLDIPSCEFLTFNGNTFTCAEKPVAPVSEVKDCKSGEIKIGTNCQVIPTCDFLRFDGKNGKFLCAQPTNSSPTQSPMIDNSQIETLVNTKFVQLASKLEQDFSQMLTSIHQKVSAGLETGKIVAVAPEMPSEKESLDGSEPSFFGTIADFFSQLFK